jgi:hypothetical protein
MTPFLVVFGLAALFNHHEALGLTLFLIAYLIRHKRFA